MEEEKKEGVESYYEGGDGGGVEMQQPPPGLPDSVEGLVKSHLAAIDKHLTTTPTSQTSASSNNAMTLISSLQEGIKDAEAISNSGLTNKSTLA